MSQTEQPAEERIDAVVYVLQYPETGVLYRQSECSGPLAFSDFRRAEAEQMAKAVGAEIRELRTRWDAPQAEGPQWWGLWHKEERRFEWGETAAGKRYAAFETPGDAQAALDAVSDSENYEPRPLCQRVESAPTSDASQCQAYGAPTHKTWDDYETGCFSAFRGGLEGIALGHFRHGMSTVFNLLRGEFPEPYIYKAAKSAPAPDLTPEECAMVNRYRALKLACDAQLTHSDALNAAWADVAKLRGELERMVAATAGGNTA